MLGITASEFRQRFPFGIARDRFIERMVQPYARLWETFHPLAKGSWDRN
jgi:hypothetical protein